MKNRTVFCAAMVLLFTASAARAMRLGTEFSGTSWKMDGKDLARDMDYRVANSLGSAELKRDKSGMEALLFVEGSSAFRLGLAAGYGRMPKVTYTTMSGAYSGFMDQGVLENAASYVPVDLYLKYKKEGGKFSLSVGAGADFITARTKVSDNLDSSGSPQANNHRGTFEQKKTVPHAQAGAEWFIFKWLSLNVRAKYLFGGVLDELKGNVTGPGAPAGDSRLLMVQGGSGEYLDYQGAGQALTSGQRPFKYDFSGLRATVGLRVYFH